jgi:acyl-coenzyme A synthetase/AMP-(fatty) acid ligase
MYRTVTEGSWLFDVDGTVVDGITGRSLRPFARELLGALRDRGTPVLLWSSGGAEYAWRRARETGIDDLVVAAFAKRARDGAGRWFLPDELVADPPSVLVDDLPAELPNVGEVIGVPAYIGPNPRDSALAALLERVRTIPLPKDMNVSSPDDRPLSARLRRVLAAAPDATALTFEHRAYPWAFVHRAVVDLGRLLSEAGEPDAHRIGIVLRNRPGHFAALVAVIATGREVVTLSPFHGDIALAEDIETLAPQVVVADGRDWARAGVVAAAADVGALPLRIGEDDRPLLAHPADWAVAPASAEPSDVAVLMQTSGTTGRPKRVELSYTALTAAFEASGTPVRAQEVRLRSHPAILWTSLVHIGGLYFVIANVAAGLQTALLERFDVEKWADLVRRTRPRRVGLAPTAMRMVLQSDLPPDTLEGVQLVSSGTAPLDPDEADRFTARFGVPVLSVYGATEFAGAIAGWNAALYDEWGAAKRGSVGRAFRGIELRIVDDTTGRPVPAGTVGVLEARGVQLPGDGWVRTTDLASLDADEFLYIHGRADDAINRGGFTIVPSVIEDALRAHPAVRDASAVGIPDERLGELPVVAVTVRDGVGRPDPDQLREWLVQRLARYQLPAEIKIVDDLPRTPSLKISRPDVQAMFVRGERVEA